ncbi:hypothetical protein ABB39_08475 [Levilactobacillus brevis]|uniref:hypothetical protein n=1 Tax=Levilactobacillus brevis TaxID=1580 RepID=UPI000760149C|nr:hypothetical protein [Levilactobacillus brevis]KWT47447.1 hypothetical protein ABB39_08475 [Levilactobacillus brevis]QWK86907.1 hypothetical protein KKI45_07825 [Levilactobacillus brevis]
MADSSRTIMTDAGFALETRVRADETKMQFTRAAISTDDHFSDTDDALAKLTELYNIQQDGKVTAVQVINTTTVYVQVDVNQAESKADYQMRSAALYAKDDDGTEVLYGVTVLQDPVFVHKDADGSYLGFGINTTVGKASNVVVVVDPANMVTQQVFEGTMKNYYTKAEVDAKFVTDDDFASKLPNNIATTDAANTFAKSQTLAGGATDGKGNAYATMKDVATGLNNGLSTKVNVTDTVNWQKNKVTNDDGGNKYSFTTANTTDLVAAIQALPLGYHTFYCQAGVQGNPSSQAVRGIAEITTAGANPLGVGYLTDSTGAFWSFYVDSSGLKLKRSADADAIDPSVMVKSTLTADDDVLALDPGTYHVWGPTPKNYPTSVWPWGIVVVKILSPDDSSVDNRLVEAFDTGNHKMFNIFSGAPLAWSGWQAPNSGIMATKSDVTTAVSAVNANMVHRNPDTGVVSEPTDFTNLTVNGGKSVATAADLKSVADKAWYKLDNKYITPASGYTLADPATNVLYKIDDSIHTLYLSGTIVLTDSNAYNVPVTVHLGSIIKSINTYLVTYLGYLRTNDHWDFDSVTPIGTNLTFLPVRGIACITAPSGTAGQYDSVTYDELV